MHDIDDDSTLRERLTNATELMVNRVGRSSRIHAMAREMFIECGPDSDFARAMNNNRELIINSLADLMMRDRAILRVPPQTAARLLMSIILAAHGQIFGEVSLLNGDEIVTLLLDGLVRRDADEPNAVSEASPVSQAKQAQ